MKCKVNDETFQVLLLFFAFFLLMNCLHFASHWLWRMRQYVSLMLNYLFLVKGVAKRLKAVLNDASLLLDFYYSIGSLVLIKVTSSNFLEWSLHFLKFLVLPKYWLFFIGIAHLPTRFWTGALPQFYGGGNAIWARVHWLFDWNFNLSIKQTKEKLWNFSSPF